MSERVAHQQRDQREVIWMDIIDGDSFWELCGEFIFNHGDDIGVSAILLVKMKRPMQGGAEANNIHPHGSIHVLPGYK